MIRFALAPRWWAWHLALVAVLVSFGWLGWWQLQSFESAGSQPLPTGRSVAIDTVTDPGGRLAPGEVGRRVRAEGTWDGERQVVVPGRELGGRVGVLVVTPLRTDEGLLPVVRGWVAGRTALPPPAGEVAVTGVLQQSETATDATVASAGLPAGQVAYVATVTLLERLPYDADEMYDGYLTLRSQDPADPAALAPVEADEQARTAGGVGRWRNLAYGLQWWLFAGAAVFFWGSVLRRAALDRPQDAGSDPDQAQPSLAAPRRTT